MYESLNTEYVQRVDVVYWKSYAVFNYNYEMLNSNPHSLNQRFVYLIPRFFPKFSHGPQNSTNPLHRFSFLPHWLISAPIGSRTPSTSKNTCKGVFKYADRFWNNLYSLSDLLTAPLYSMKEVQDVKVYWLLRPM